MKNLGLRYLQLCFFSGAASLALISCTKLLTTQKMSSMTLAPTANALAGNCVPIQLTVGMNDGHPAQSSTNATITGATLYSDMACTTTETSVTIPAGSNSQIFYVRDTKAETMNLAANENGVGTNLSLTVLPAPASQLYVSGPTSLSAGVCTPLVIQSQDAFGNISPLTAQVNVSFDQDGSAVFSSDYKCASGSISGATIAPGQTQIIVYVLDNKAEEVTLSASDTATTNPLKSFSLTNNTVQPGAPSRLSVSQMTAQFTAGACTAFSVSITDSLGNLVNATSALTVTPSGSSIFSNSNCTTSATSITIATGTSAQPFYIKDTKAETLTLSAKAGTLSTPSGTPYMVQPGSATTLVLTGGPSISSGVLNPLTVKKQDDFGNLSTMGSAVTLTLTQTGSAVFIGNNNSTITTLTIPANTNSVSFFVVDGALDTNLTLTASATGLTAGSVTGVTVVPGPPAAINVTPPNPIVANYCNPMMATLSDGEGHPANATANFVVGLIITSVNNYFYSDSACSTPVTQVTIPSGSSSVVYYFKDPVYEAAPNLYQVTDVNNALAQCQGPCVASNAASSIVVPGPNVMGIANPTPPTGKLGTDKCVGPFTISTNPAGSTTTVNFPINYQETGTVGVFSDSGCTVSALGTIYIKSGMSSGSFYLKDGISETVTLMFSPVMFGPFGGGFAVPFSF